MPIAMNHGDECRMRRWLRHFTRWVTRALRSYRYRIVITCRSGTTCGQVMKSPKPFCRSSTRTNILAIPTDSTMCDEVHSPRAAQDMDICPSVRQVKVIEFDSVRVGFRPHASFNFLPDLFSRWVK